MSRKEKDHPVEKYSLAQILFSIPLIIFGIPTLIGYLGSLNWLFDLTSHFREYYLIAFVILSLVGIFLRFRVLSVFAVVFLFLNLFSFIPFYYPVEKGSSSDTKLVILSANIELENRAYDRLISYVNEVNPDVIVLEEVDQAWVTGISSLTKSYPYSLAEAHDDYSGIMVLSKHPLENPHMEYLGRAGKPSALATIAVGKKKLTVIGMHPHPPFGERSSLERDRQIEQLGVLAMAQTTPTIIIGDMNSTPFSYPYRQLLATTDLEDCAWGFGYPHTWQRAWYLPPLRLSIDHCFHTPDAFAYDSYVGKDIGSDHLPIIVGIALK